MAPWLSFLDDDVLLPPQYLEWARHHCTDKVVVMGQRWESERPTPLYWKKFYAKANQWNEIDRHGDMFALIL